MPVFIASPQFIMIFVVCLIIISFIASMLFKPEEFAKSRISVFVSILAGIAVLLIGVNLALSTAGARYSQQIARVNETKNAVDKLWLYPNLLLVNSKNARQAFLSSFYFNNHYLQTACSKQSSEESTSCFSVLEEQNIAIVMLQAWEDCLTYRRIDNTGDIVWACNFIQWAQSPYLKEYFNILKYNFKDTTIMFGEILFKYAEQIPRQNSDPEMYLKTVTLMLKDPEYLHVIDLVNEGIVNYDTSF